MASYHLWHPEYVIAEPLTLEAFVTKGDALLPPRGGAATAEAALAVLGLELEARTARLTALRTHYFSSYRGVSGDWEDDWALVWRLRVTLVSRRAPAIPAPPGWGAFDLDAGGAVPEAAEEWPCLLIADARDDATIEAAEDVVAEHQPDATLVRAHAFGRYPQLRCELPARPAAWYEQGAPRRRPRSTGSPRPARPCAGTVSPTRSGPTESDLRRPQPVRIRHRPRLPQAARAAAGGGGGVRRIRVGTRRACARACSRALRARSCRRRRRTGARSSGCGGRRVSLRSTWSPMIFEAFAASDVVGKHVAAWNEPDEAARTRSPGRSWSDRVVHCDPTAAVGGREALVAHIGGPGKRLPCTYPPAGHAG